MFLIPITKKHRNIFESNIISNNNNIKKNTVFSIISLFSQIRAKSYKIPYSKYLNSSRDHSKISNSDITKKKK